MRKIEKQIILIFGILILLLYGFAGLYCHPSADDFTYAIKGQSEFFFQDVMKERLIWNGRYFSNFLVFLNPLNFGGLLTYKMFPFALLIFIFTGTYFFYKLISLNYSFLFSTVTLLISFSIMPDITEGLYWYTGAITYLPGIVIFLIGLGIYIRGNLKFIHYLTLIILFVISSGFNELISLLGIATFMIYFLEKRNIKHLLIVLLFVLLFYYIYSAPGNTIRESYFSQKHQFYKSFYLSLAYTIRFIGEWLLNPAFIFWGLTIANLKINDSIVKKSNLFRKPLVIILVLVGPTFISCFVPIWSTGMLGQYRTANLASFLFVISFTVIITSNKYYLMNKISRILKFKYKFVFLIIFIFFWKNHLILQKEIINGEIFAFDKEMKQRYSLIKKCGLNDCYLPSIKNRPFTLFLYPIVDNPKDWKNENYQKFFNSGKIFKYD
tara:strand:- start:2764 stop:4077 length:1314 start_codon:yes stop_codon:yes gene_type:complete